MDNFDYNRPGEGIQQLNNNMVKIIATLPIPVYLKIKNHPYGVILNYQNLARMQNRFLLEDLDRWQR